MDRRQFFRRAATRTGETVVRHVDRRAAARAAHWIRPPFALDELEFLLACSRCGDCVTACPAQIVFPLSARLGAEVVGTPALDLLHHGCQMCEDWPCVQACTPGALRLPDDREGGAGAGETPRRPRLATASIDTASCLPYSGPECGACAICPVPGALVWEREKPRIDPDNCTGCALCREACIVEPKAIHIASVHRKESYSQS